MTISSQNRNLPHCLGHLNETFFGKKQNLVKLLSLFMLALYVLCGKLYYSKQAISTKGRLRKCVVLT